MRTHGTISCYQAGCRCPLCHVAQRAQRQRYRNQAAADRPRIVTNAGAGECRFCGRWCRTGSGRLLHERACAR